LRLGTEQCIVWPLLLLLGVAPGRTELERTDPSKEARSALFRSAICPGLGQLKAGSTLKGVLFIAASGALIYGHMRSSAWPSGQRRELTRWSVLFWLYNVGDAYVDGYLRSFDAEMDEVDSIGNGLLHESSTGPRVGLGMSLRW
jgi:hypothetical protein